MLGLFDDTRIWFILESWLWSVLTRKRKFLNLFWGERAAKQQIRRGKKHHLIKVQEKNVMEGVKITQLTTATQQNIYQWLLERCGEILLTQKLSLYTNNHLT